MKRLLPAAGKALAHLRMALRRQRECAFLASGRRPNLRDDRRLSRSRWYLPRERRAVGALSRMAVSIARIPSGFVGALSEAIAELRIHRTRVLLSLTGVAVAVAAITSVVGVGSLAQQATTESLERQSGRPATLFVAAYSYTTEPPNPTAVDKAFRAAADRYQIGHAGAVGHFDKSVQFIDGPDIVSGMAVDVSFAAMHRVQVMQGRWFGDADERRLAPAIVINEVFYDRLGRPDLRTHPTVTLLDEQDTLALIVGVVPAAEFDGASMFMLNSAYARTVSPAELEQNLPQFELWVPPDLSDQLAGLIQRDVSGALGDGIVVEVSRADYAGWSEDDPLLPFKLVVGGVAILVLLLGALGLVNIALVTVRQRIREIGIRRSFGATAPRVFFAVMMESVVASFVAGVVGVMIAVVVVQSPQVRDFVASGIIDVPPFPLEAAVLGLAAATGVGALAGLLPALIAVRVKVIDAIRY